jgi:hypothetical protein
MHVVQIVGKRTIMLKPHYLANIKGYIPNQRENFCSRQSVYWISPWQSIITYFDPDINAKSFLKWWVPSSQHSPVSSQVMENVYSTPCECCLISPQYTAKCPVHLQMCRSHWQNLRQIILPWWLFLYEFYMKIIQLSLVQCMSNWLWGDLSHIWPHEC